MTHKIHILYDLFCVHLDMNGREKTERHSLGCEKKYRPQKTSCASCVTCNSSLHLLLLPPCKVGRLGLKL